MSRKQVRTEYADLDARQRIRAECLRHGVKLQEYYNATGVYKVMTLQHFYEVMNGAACTPINAAVVDNSLVFWADHVAASGRSDIAQSRAPVMLEFLKLKRALYQVTQAVDAIIKALDAEADDAAKILKQRHHDE